MALLNTTTAVCRVLSEKYHATVKIMGSRAYTDGTNYVIPDLGELDDTKMTILRGYLDHEAGGHGPYTDFKVLELVKSQKVGAMLNMIEDIRVETLLGAKYPGCKNNLSALNEMMSGEFKKPYGAMQALFIEGYRAVAGQVLTAPDCLVMVNKAFGTGILDEIAKLENTSQALQLAQRIIAEAETKLEEAKAKAEEAKLEAKAEETGGDEDESLEECSSGGENEDSEESPEEGKESEDTFPGGESDAEAEGAVREEEKGTGGEESEGGSSNEDGKDTGGMGFDEPGGVGEEEEIEELLRDIEEMKDKSEVLSDMMGDFHSDLVDSKNYSVFSTDGDMVHKNGESETVHEYDRLLRGLEGLNVLKGRVARLFMSQRSSKWIGDRDRGRINNRALAKIATGNRRIFKDKYVVQDVNTAASFLVDFSGSMYDDKMRAAMSSVVMFIETLDPIGVKSEILGYTTAGYSAGYDGTSGYGRVENLNTVVFKTFAEKKSITVKKRISNWQSVIRSQNCDPDSVMVALSRLMQRPEQRKILFVLTDGAVANKGDTGKGMDELKRIITEAEKTGKVEIIGIELMASGAGRYYKKLIRVKRPEGLAPALFEGLKNCLLK